MGKPSRSKGKRGELEVVKILNAHGYDVRRTPNSGGLHWKGDIIGLDGFCVEVKRCESLQLPKWWSKLVLEAGRNMPLLAHRRSNEEWLVTMRLQDLLGLMREE